MRLSLAIYLFPNLESFPLEYKIKLFNLLLNDDTVEFRELQNFFKAFFCKKMSNFLVLQCFTAVKFCLTAQQRSKGVGEGLLDLVEILKDFLTTTHQR